MTLSAADATAHIVENPLVPACARASTGCCVTLVLLALLGVVFLAASARRSAWPSAWSRVYLVLNLVVVGGRGSGHVATDLRRWSPTGRRRLTTAARQPAR